MERSLSVHRLSHGYWYGIAVISATILSIVPTPVKNWIDSRFNQSEMIMDDKASLTWYVLGERGFVRIADRTGNLLEIAFIYDVCGSWSLWVLRWRTVLGGVRAPYIASQAHVVRDRWLVHYGRGCFYDLFHRRSFGFIGEVFQLWSL